uniref:Skp1-related protein n=1 Tax=Rhabditophanes sp. KR3021 TaxID=114890 RepID=A0AC35TRM1_9BILA
MSAKSIPVLTTDNNQLDLPMCVVERSGALIQMINDPGIELDSTEQIERIPLQCGTQGLQKIIEICQFYEDNPEPEKSDTVDAKDVYQQKMDEYITQFHVDVKDYNWILILAADYLEIKFIFDILCKDVSEAMRGKTVQQLREMYDIENDFSKEEIEYLENANKWADA